MKRDATVKPETLGQTLIVLAGEVGAHKHNISETLSSSLGTQMVAFSTYLKRVLDRSQVPISYKTLQDLGQQTIEVAGWQRYCHAVLSPHAEADFLVVDGLRHVSAVRFLRQIARPRDVFLIYVETTREQQLENLRAKLEKTGEDVKQIPAILDHPVERESGLVRYLADKRIRSVDDRGLLVADVQELIARKRAGEAAEIFRRLRIADSDRDRIDKDTDRYESLREVVRLLNSVAGENAPLDGWFRTAVSEGERRTPLECILYGNPSDAVAAALNTIENI